MREIEIAATGVCLQPVTSGRWSQVRDLGWLYKPLTLPLIRPFKCYEDYTLKIHIRIVIVI